MEIVRKLKKFKRHVNTLCNSNASVYRVYHTSCWHSTLRTHNIESATTSTTRVVLVLALGLPSAVAN